jgi:hypothetical protein
MSASSTLSLPVSAAPDAESMQWYARLAGVLGLITFVAGGFGEAYAPAQIFVSGDATATAANILRMEGLFRWGFAGYLVEALCDASLTMAFWVLLRPVHLQMAMLMVVFRIISTCGFGAGEVLYYGALVALRGGQPLAAIEPGQLDALSYLLIRIGSFGGAMFSMFYGAANIVMGVLFYRSRYIPRLISAGVIVMGVAFVLQIFVRVVAPAYASPLFMGSAALFFPPLVLWLLIKGVNVNARARAWRRLSED